MTAQNFARALPRALAHEDDFVNRAEHLGPLRGRHAASACGATGRDVRWHRLTKTRSTKTNAKKGRPGRERAADLPVIVRVRPDRGERGFAECASHRDGVERPLQPLHRLAGPELMAPSKTT